MYTSTCRKRANKEKNKNLYVANLCVCLRGCQRRSIQAVFLLQQLSVGTGGYTVSPPQAKGGGGNFKVEHPLSCIWLFHNVKTVRDAQTLTMYQDICVHYSFVVYAWFINATEKIILLNLYI